MELYQTEPNLFTTVPTIDGYITIIRTGIRQLTQEEQENTPEGTAWQCEEVEYSHQEPLSRDKDYGPIVSAIIRSRFSSDEVEAIQMNYMESKTTEHKNEFTQLREWRAFAKNTARGIFDTLEA